MRLWELFNTAPLNELLNQPVTWEWKKKSERSWVAKFAIHETTFFVYFDGSDKDDVEISFTGDGREDITGEGNSFTVFATVSEIVRDFLKHRHPYSVNFNAKEPSRMKLYSRFASLIAKEFNGDLSRHNGQDGKFKIYLREDGKIIPNVNTTCDVQPGETERQAAKFGNELDSKGRPPLLSGSYGDDTARFSANQGDPFYGSDGTRLTVSRK